MINVVAALMLLAIPASASNPLMAEALVGLENGDRAAAYPKMEEAFRAENTMDGKGRIAAILAQAPQENLSLQKSLYARFALDHADGATTALKLQKLLRIVADSYFEKALFPEAAAAYARILEIKNGSPDIAGYAIHQLGWVYMNQKKPGQSFELWRARATGGGLKDPGFAGPLAKDAGRAWAEAGFAGDPAPFVEKTESALRAQFWEGAKTGLKRSGASAGCGMIRWINGKTASFVSLDMIELSFKSCLSEFSIKSPDGKRLVDSFIAISGALPDAHKAWSHSKLPLIMLEGAASKEQTVSLLRLYAAKPVSGVMAGHLDSQLKNASKHEAITLLQEFVPLESDLALAHIRAWSALRQDLQIAKRYLGVLKQTLATAGGHPERQYNEDKKAVAYLLLDAGDAATVLAELDMLEDAIAANTAAAARVVTAAMDEPALLKNTSASRRTGIATYARLLRAMIDGKMIDGRDLDRAARPALVRHPIHADALKLRDLIASEQHFRTLELKRPDQRKIKAVLSANISRLKKMLADAASFRWHNGLLQKKSALLLDSSVRLFADLIDSLGADPQLGPEGAGQLKALAEMVRAWRTEARG